MSAFSSDKDQRGAARHTLPRPVPATLGGYAGNLTEISLTGCQFEHVDRVTPKQRLPLRFTWRKTPVRIEALVVRSQMKLVKGKAAYTSGLEFCANANESPAVIRDIISWLDKEKAREIAAAEPPPPTPKTDDKEKVPSTLR